MARSSYHGQSFSEQRHWQSGYEINPRELKIGPLIGKGAEGEVRKGRLGGAAVAIKIVELHSCSEEEEAKTLAEARKEAELLSKLHHPNVVTLFGISVFSAGGGGRDMQSTTVMTVIDLCSCSLKDYVTSADTGHTISPAHMCQLLVGISRGMGYLHSRGIIHKDLKPANGTGCVLLFSMHNTHCLLLFSMHTTDCLLLFSMNNTDCAYCCSL
jgi:serine/threonine protein kinase